METNNINTSVATPLFSWRDYWKTFAWLLTGYLLILSVLLVRETSIHIGSYTLYSINNEAPPFIFFYLIPIAIIMGEAFLALIFSKRKNSSDIVFILHGLAYVILLGLPIIPIITSNNYYDGDGFGEVIMLIFWMGSGSLLFFYSLVRMTRWRSSRRKYPEKSFSLTFVRWFLAHAFKIHVILFIVILLGQFLL